VAAADCVLSDPPYGTTNCGWDTVPDLQRLRQAVEGSTKTAANLVIFAAQPFSTDLISAWRPWFRYDLIWEKSIAVGFLDAKRRPLRAHEHVLIFGRKKAAAAYVPQMTIGVPSSNPKAAATPRVAREDVHAGGRARRRSLCGKRHDRRGLPDHRPTFFGK